ncbi:MAG: hypothetical protein MUP40_04335 [Actinobacteria bacterium]|nr:hypothetical protein [Actinomycetota bacterium]
MEHRVITYSGHCYAQEPREFYIGEEHHRVVAVKTTWMEETAGFSGMTRQVWRVVDQHDEPYRLTYYRVSDFWEIEKD